MGDLLDPHRPIPLASRTREEAIFSLAYSADDNPAQAFQAAKILMKDVETAKIRAAAKRLLQWMPVPRPGDN